MWAQTALSRAFSRQNRLSGQRDACKRGALGGDPYGLGLREAQTAFLLAHPPPRAPASRMLDQSGARWPARGRKARRRKE